MQLKANDVLKVSVLFYLSRSDRKILDRVLKSKHMSSHVTVLAETNFLLGLRSPAALFDDSFECGELVQVQDIEALVSCLMIFQL